MMMMMIRKNKVNAVYVFTERSLVPLLCLPSFLPSFLFPTATNNDNPHMYKIHVYFIP